MIKDLCRHCVLLHYECSTYSDGLASKDNVEPSDFGPEGCWVYGLGAG